MVFPSDTSNSARLILDGQEIKKVNNCRYLGVTVDDELKWTEHIDYIHSKLLKSTSIFYKLRAKIPKRILLNVYYAYVQCSSLLALCC